MLVSQTRGGLYEHFFEEVGKPVYGDGRPLVCEDQPGVGESWRLPLSTASRCHSPSQGRAS
jgi:hypothetical protein